MKTWIYEKQNDYRLSQASVIKSTLEISDWMQKINNFI